MKEYRLGPPNGELITRNQNTNSSVRTGTITTFAGITETETTNSVSWLPPVVLKAEDLNVSPTILELDVFGFAEGFTNATVGSLTITIEGDTTLTKELATFKTAGGVFTYPTSVAGQQSAMTTQLLNHQTATFAPVVGKRMGWHYNAKVCFLSSVRSSDTTNVCKQLTTGTLILNRDTGVYDVTTANNNTYVTSTADETNTIVRHCAALTGHDHSAGIKLALGISKTGGFVGGRFIASYAVARLYPDSYSSNSILNKGI